MLPQSNAEISVRRVEKMHGEEWMHSNENNNKIIMAEIEVNENIDKKWLAHLSHNIDISLKVKRIIRPNFISL